MMYTDPSVFDGYPYPQITQTPVIGLSVPHPAVFSGYPYRRVNYADLFFTGLSHLRMAGSAPSALSYGQTPCLAAYYGGALVYLRG